MADLSQMLSDLLNSPDGMEKLQDAAASLGISAPPSAVPTTAPPDSGGFDLSALGDMSVIAKLAPMMKDMKNDDDNTRLLKAIRPYLQPERKEKLDQSVKIIRLLKFLPLLKEGGDLF